MSSNHTRAVRKNNRRLALKRGGGGKKDHYDYDYEVLTPPEPPSRIERF